MESITGMIVRTTDYSESSKILSVLTEEYGLISILAKGARRLKSDYRSACEKLTLASFQISYKPDKLSTLISVDVITTYKRIKQDIHKISYAGFLLELSEQVMKQTSEEQVYSILKSGLLKIEEGYDPAIITNIMELKYLYFLGVMPIIDGCSICGNHTSIATLSSDRGGYVCNRCLTTEPVVSEKTIKLIRMFYYVDIDKINKLEINDQEKKEINQFLDTYYESYTGLYLKTKSFLKNLNKLTAE